MKFTIRAITLATAMALSNGIHAADTNAPHWGYGEAGKWGDLSAEFKECKLGKEQSPIDIQTKAAEKTKLAAIGFNYKAGAGDVVNNGHTIQVNLTDAGSAKLAGSDYQLLQFHFHTPSEEKVDGKNFPLVAHLVHKSAAGGLGVVGVMFKEGKENAALKPVFDAMPAKEGGKAALKANLNAADFLPADKGYYAFKGSLTTPPCSEGVAWQVMKQPVELSKGQIEAFRKLYKMNARPVQPLNGRKVQVSS
ncbi:MAG: carbonic anhydrase family protein [Betaproteobacteria bacterium]|nr:carbonic anhydrase family protein [Betaproteobacteria bacterium]